MILFPSRSFRTYLTHLFFAFTAKVFKVYTNSHTAFECVEDDMKEEDRSGFKRGSGGISYQLEHLFVYFIFSFNNLPVVNTLTALFDSGLDDTTRTKLGTSLLDGPLTGFWSLVRFRWKSFNQTAEC